jgi:hypothetical protein
MEEKLEALKLLVAPKTGGSAPIDNPVW